MTHLLRGTEMRHFVAICIAVHLWNTAVAEPFKPVLVGTSDGLSVGFPSVGPKFAIWNENRADGDGIPVTHIYDLATGISETVESGLNAPAQNEQTLGFVKDSDSVLCLDHRIKPECDFDAGTRGREPWIRNLQDGSEHNLWAEPYILSFVDLELGDEWLVWAGSLNHSEDFYPGTGWNVYARRLGPAGPEGPLVEVAAGPNTEVEPSVAGSHISWTDRGGGLGTPGFGKPWSVMLLNMETEEVTEILHADHSKLADDYIAWSGVFPHSGIWVARYDDFGAPLQLSEQSGFVDVHGDAVVWVDRSARSTIFHHDLLTNTTMEIELPLSEGSQVARIVWDPQLYENTLFWLQTESIGGNPLFSAYVMEVPEPSSMHMAMIGGLWIFLRLRVNMKRVSNDA